MAGGELILNDDGIVMLDDDTGAEKISEAGDCGNCGCGYCFPDGLAWCGEIPRYGLEFEVTITFSCGVYGGYYDVPTGDVDEHGIPITDQYGFHNRVTATWTGTLLPSFWPDTPIAFDPGGATEVENLILVSTDGKPGHGYIAIARRNCDDGSKMIRVQATILDSSVSPAQPSPLSGSVTAFGLGGTLIAAGGDEWSDITLGTGDLKQSGPVSSYAPSISVSISVTSEVDLADVPPLEYPDTLSAELYEVEGDPPLTLTFERRGKHYRAVSEDDVTYVIFTLGAACMPVIASLAGGIIDTDDATLLTNTFTRAAFRLRRTPGGFSGAYVGKSTFYPVLGLPFVIEGLWATIGANDTPANPSVTWSWGTWASYLSYDHTTETFLQPPDFSPKPDEPDFLEYYCAGAALCVPCETYTVTIDGTPHILAASGSEFTDGVITLRKVIPDDFIISYSSTKYASNAYGFWYIQRNSDSAILGTKPAWTFPQGQPGFTPKSGVTTIAVECGGVPCPEFECENADPCEIDTSGTWYTLIGIVVTVDGSDNFVITESEFEEPSSDGLTDGDVGIIKCCGPYIHFLTSGCEELIAPATARGSCIQLHDDIAGKPRFLVRAKDYTLDMTGLATGLTMTAGNGSPACISTAGGSVVTGTGYYTLRPDYSGTDVVWTLYVESTSSYALATAVGPCVPTTMTPTSTGTAIGITAVSITPIL